MRISRLPREACAYIKLKRLGVSINLMSKIIGRSYSFVHRILKKFRFSDLRKLPRIIRLRRASMNRFFMLKYCEAWQKFILGEGEKPP